MNNPAIRSPLYWAQKYTLPEVSVPARTVLLKEGAKAKHIYFIKKGCLRLWVNNNGLEVTSQFFFEDNIVASLESILTGQASDFVLEAIEPSDLYVLEKKRFEQLSAEDAGFKEWFSQYMLNRFIYYSRHLVSFLKDKPMDRYRKLLLHNPQIVQRIPQHYIASYLGITPVSLSRIRNKIIKTAP